MSTTTTTAHTPIFALLDDLADPAPSHSKPHPEPDASQLQRTPLHANNKLRNTVDHPIETASKDPPPAQQTFSDPALLAPDFFSLDFVSTDMDFEQAYLMYSNLQQKNALSGVEQLQKAQTLNLHYSSMFSVPPPAYMLAPDEKFDFHRSQILSRDQPKSAPTPRAFPENFTPQHMGSDDDDQDFDKFFSNNESNALERFLDGLATLSSGNPLEFYHGQPVADFNLFDLHTMKGPSAPANRLPLSLALLVLLQDHRSNDDIHAMLKNEITEAFAHPPLASAKFPDPVMLPTPMDLRQRLQLQIVEMPKRPLEEPESELLRKRRRSSNKPLLLLEQKRLNHSHSEQKRRQLCKLAYERCLRLITNVEDYKNEVMRALALLSLKKKSKRRQLTKEGLPNLLKHTALVKISSEMLKIQGKNARLVQMLEAQGIRAGDS